MKILIVDDKDEGRYMFESLLKGGGYKVVSAGNGIEATEILRNDSIDIIISDILMPKMDGFAFCRQCKSDDSLRKIPFIFYTATYTDKKDEEFGLSLGAEKFLVKPIEPDELLTVVNDVIEKHKEGTIIAAKKPVAEKTVYLAQYNKRLIEKLEHKVVNLEEELARRKKAELTLRMSEQRFRAIADYTYSWELWVSPKGNLIWTSPAVEKITGFLVDQCMGMKGFPLQLVDMQDRNKAAPVFKPTSIDSTGEGVEFRIRRKLGTLIWVSASWQPIRDIKGSPQGFRIGISDITKRKEAEDKLRDYHAKLKAMAISSLLTEEHERQRIAQDLHDDIGQKLAMAKVGLQSSSGDQQGRITLELSKKLCSNIDEMIERVRSLTFELSNPVLTELGLEAALERHLNREIRDKHKIEFQLNKSGALTKLDKDMSMCLFRSVRELLNNIVKHSNARNVSVSLDKADDNITIRVNDDGVGFDPAAVNSKINAGVGFGLFSIREQIESFAGELKVESSPGQGSTFTINVPLEQGSK